MDYGADNMPISLRAKLLLRYDLFRYDLRKVPEKFMFAVAWCVPKWLVYFVGIRLWAHATTGKYSDVNATDIKMSDVIKAWEEDGA